MMHTEFNSVVLFTILYSRFQHCTKDMSKVTAQRTILEYENNLQRVKEAMVKEQYLCNQL